MNICEWIDHWDRETPDNIALNFEHQSYSYAGFSREVDRFSGFLHSCYGVRKGDRIAYLGLNSPEFLFLLFASAKIGAIVTPLNWRLTLAELRPLLEDADPVLMFADTDMQDGWTGSGQKGSCRFLSIDDECAEGWEIFRCDNDSREVPVEKDCADDPLLLVYTSGTTGVPKGALLTHKALLANAMNSQVMHQLDSEDHSLISLPFFHVGGLNILTTPTFFVGGTVTLQRTFDPDAMLAALMENRPTRAPIVSAQMPPILALPDWQDARFPKLRSVTTGASPVPPNVYESWQAKGVAVLQVYGATETCPIAICTRLDDDAPTIRTTGRAAAQCEVRLVDDNHRDVHHGEAGEIVVRGDNVMKGYWQNPAATREVLQDGWYATGDIGRQDEHGYYYVIDRKSDLIISGGENIYPAEIEKLLLESDLIADAAVVAKPDDRWGEVPVAVVRSASGKKLTEADVLASLEGRLGRYKMPKAVIFVDDFPRNSVGKIQKFALREQLFRE